MSHDSATAAPTLTRSIWPHFPQSGLGGSGAWPMLSPAIDAGAYAYSRLAFKRSRVWQPPNCLTSRPRRAQDARTGHGKSEPTLVAYHRPAGKDRVLSC